MNVASKQGGKDMAKEKAGESKTSQARQTRGSKKQPATRTLKGAGNKQAVDETAELQKPLTKLEQSEKRKAPADGKPSAGEETPAAEVNTASSGQAEASAEKQAHAAGGSEAKDADVQQEESGTEQLQKQPSEASLEVSATEAAEREAAAGPISAADTLEHFILYKGLQTCLLQEEADEDRGAAPESAAEEEERLRQEREAKAPKEMQNPMAAAQASMLSKTQAEKLDMLLEQAGLYTQFLTEQMDDIVTRLPDAEAPEAEEGKAGGKRKGGKQGGKDAKKAKVGPTQALLPLMVGEMRDYQLRGVRWMISLHQNGLNGILADQMGLGKTVQTIGFFSHLRSNNVQGCTLVVGPLSTLTNWVSEVERWCPSMPALLYHGTKQERAELRRKRMPTSKDKIKDFPVVITSYEIIIADSKFLQKYPWTYIAVDEGHRLKNFNCRLLRELRCFSASNKLLLSGTPLQNNLSELWSLLNFLLPDVFNNLANFESWFDFSSVGEAAGNKEIAAKEQRDKVVTKLHAILRPFLLRRVKSDVETDLPAKKEIILYAGMTDVQRKLHSELRERTLADAMASMSKKQGGGVGNVGKLNNVLMQMRKVCNHPDLITGAFDGSTTYPSSEEMRQQGGKFQLLDKLLVKLHKKGHRVLVFSQMTKMLDLLDSYLDQEGHRVCRIDGSTSWQQRQEAMRAFNEDKDVFCFLLSTRAGGLGINLTSADTVIIYDSDWNPHQDMQAMDRAHRIGQTKPVLVFRLATGQSVEGRLLKRANSKLMLEKLVIKQGAFLDNEATKKSSSLSAEELLELLDVEKSFQDKAQSGVVSDQMLDKLLDRAHMLNGKPAPYKDVDVGFEVVHHGDGSGILASVNK